MTSKQKTKEQLLNEMEKMREQISVLETSGAEHKRTEEELQKKTHDLEERVKELNTFYEMANLVVTQDKSLEEIIQGTVELIPRGWQYPEVTCTRIILDEKEYKTENFSKTSWEQACDIKVHYKKSGSVEVFYLKEKPGADEGPFLKEERKLINAIAERLGRIIERKQAEEAVLKSEQDLKLRNKIANIFLTVPDEEMYVEVLHVILEATESKYGVFGYIDEEGAFICPSMTRDIWDKCQIIDKDIKFPRETWGDSIWARSIREKKTLYSNEPFCVPEGHIPIQRALMVPIIHHEEVIGLFEVANSPTDYEQKSIKLLENNAEYIAPVLNARLQRDREEKARKRAEEELKKTLSDLERSNQELEQFAYVASHDLQEPLRMVASYTQLLKKRYKNKLDPDAQDFINFAVDGANRMQRLINDLLEYSRMEIRGKLFKKIDCFSILGNAISNLKMHIDSNHAVIMNDDLPTVKGDKTQLVRLFQNLIDNAIKFRGNESPRIHVSARKNESNWQFSIKDNGIGFDPKYKERIFTIFKRLHGRNDYAGTGIGLAI